MREQRKAPRAQPPRPFKLTEDERGFLAGVVGHTQYKALDKVVGELLASMTDEILKTDVMEADGERHLLHRKLRQEGAAKLARELFSFLASLKKPEQDA